MKYLLIEYLTEEYDVHRIRIRYLISDTVAFFNRVPNSNVFIVKEHEVEKFEEVHYWGTESYIHYVKKLLNHLQTDAIPHFMIII